MQAETICRARPNSGRFAITSQPTTEKLREIINDREFKKLFGGLEGDRLTRPPMGFPSDHPAVDLLRYKQFLAYSTNPAELAQSEDLLPLIVRNFRAMMPLLRFLNAPLSKASAAGSRRPVTGVE